MLWRKSIVDLIGIKKNHHEHGGEHHSQLGLPTILSIILFSLFSFLPINRQVYAEEKHIILEESGIHYPGGFDLNTVGEVQGKASHFFRPGRGPVHFLLTTDREVLYGIDLPPLVLGGKPYQNLGGKRSLRPGVKIIRERRQTIHCCSGTAHSIFRAIFCISGKRWNALVERSRSVRAGAPE